MYLIDLGDDSAEFSTPDVVEGDDVAVLTSDGDAPSSVVQFATFGPDGQTGILTANVRPTYQ
jgi:hypothetical protein